ncbi:hypothetical protein PHMEG_00015225 [Phytophthora megakarya]|uniref:Uncharacterized protein n=1 Tax=Phytophthora megakarya TaxID=4795 RepID=A0A225W1W7_9STRA|nr:hypothetical protein PHMEG_00015225 [Phytophthora megakarya]
MPTVSDVAEFTIAVCYPAMKPNLTMTHCGILFYIPMESPGERTNCYSRVNKIATMTATTKDEQILVETAKT